MPERVLNSLAGAEVACASLFDEVPCYISIQDREHRIVDANRKVIQDFGDPIGKPCYSVYKRRATSCPECTVERTFEDGREHTSEEKVFDLRDLPHDMVVNTRPLRDRSGKVVAVIELFTDITQRKELEYRLHESLSRFHNLFDTVPCYISVQNRDFRILEANERFKESFGPRTGEHCYEVYKGRHDRCPECPVALTFDDGRTHTGEHVLTDQAGRQVHVVVHTAALRDASGKIVSVMEVSDDITEIRALQDKLASLGRVVAGIAHSIKNVLEGLRGGVYITNLGFRDNNQQDVRAGCEMIERNVGRLSAMILDMLYYAKDRSPQRLPVALGPLAAEVVALYRPRAGEFSVGLDAESAAAGCTVSGEAKDLHSLLANLVGNAIDACLADEDESKQHRVKVRVFPDGKDAVLEVEDNGAGMDDETRSNLFTMFFSTKGAFGTGLGLLVAQKVAAEHGGSIAVTSAPGMGATFTVRLPLEGTA